MDEVNKYASQDSLRCVRSGSDTSAVYEREVYILMAE
jgi:hypothetical protein